MRQLLKKFLADTTTPVSIYLKVRDHFESSLLLESTDFRSVENCFSFICMEPIASFEVTGKNIQTLSVDGKTETGTLESNDLVPEKLNQFMNQFDIEPPENYKGINGFFGYMSFEAVQYFDSMNFDDSKRKMDIPEVNYKLFRYIIAVNHFNDELFILENIPPGANSEIEKIENLLSHQTFGQYEFKVEGNETSNITDEDFKELVKKRKRPLSSR